MRLKLLTLLVLPLSVACTSADGSRSGGVIDSIVPWDTALARFRTGLDTVEALEGGAASRDDLIRLFVDRLEAADTAALAALTLSRAEFAWLYYPTIPEAHPPYDLAPGLMWFMLEGNSAKGLRRALEEYGGEPLAFAGYRCEGEPRMHDANRVHPLCIVRHLAAPGGDTLEIRLFGPILEREGRFKFVSLTNRL